MTKYRTQEKEAIWRSGFHNDRLLITAQDKSVSVFAPLNELLALAASRGRLVRVVFC